MAYPCFVRNIILNLYSNHGFYLASPELNNSVNCYCLPACFEKCMSQASAEYGNRGVYACERSVTDSR